MSRKLKWVVVLMATTILLLVGCTSDETEKEGKEKKEEKTVASAQKEKDGDEKQVSKLNTKETGVYKCDHIKPEDSSDPAYIAMMNPDTEVGQSWQKLFEAQEQIYLNSVKEVKEAEKNIIDLEKEIKELENELVVLKEKLASIPKDEEHKIERMLFENGDIFNVESKISTLKWTVETVTKTKDKMDESNKWFEAYKTCHFPNEK